MFSQAKVLVTKSFYNPTRYAQVLLLCPIVNKNIKSFQGQEAPPGLLMSIPGLLGSHQGLCLQRTPKYWKWHFNYLCRRSKRLFPHKALFEDDPPTMKLNISNNLCWIRVDERSSQLYPFWCVHLSFVEGTHDP